MWRWSGQLFDLLVQWLSGICSCRWRFGYFKVELCTHASNLVWGLGIQLGNEERENMKCPPQPTPNLSLFMFSFWPLPLLFSSLHWRVSIHLVPFLSASLVLIALLLISQPFVLHSSISFSLTVFPFVLHHLQCLSHSLHLWTSLIPFSRIPEIKTPLVNPVTVHVAELKQYNTCYQMTGDDGM